jgi:HEPN domain-containing protein
MSAEIDHAHELLGKAANDLIAAEATLPTGHATDTVCFHAQQAVEKSLKALLTSRGAAYPFTHDLSELVELVMPLFPTLAPYEDRIINLTPFAVTVRYYGVDSPSLEEATAAFQLAREVHQLLKDYVNTSPSE